MKEKLKESKGITLIALIVTIIVLIILAGVSINLVLGDSGIITKAKEAKQNIELAANEEEQALANLEIALKEEMNGEEPKPPTDKKYFTYVLNQQTKEATITGIKEEYSVKGYYKQQLTEYTTAIKDGDKYITDIVIPSKITEGNTTYTVTEISDNAFSCGSIPADIDVTTSVAYYTSFVLPNTIKHIGNRTFSGCTQVKNINIPSSVISIGNSAFKCCKSLTSINIPTGVTSIGSWAFSHCSSLTSINIPSSVTSIGEYAFSSCSILTSINIPSSVTSIGSSAFSYCNKLKTVNYGGTQEQWNKIQIDTYGNDILKSATINYNS